MKVSFRTLAIILAVLPSTAAAGAESDGVLDVLRDVCLATEANYPAVLDTMAGLTQWEKVPHPPATGLIEGTAWALRGLGPETMTQARDAEGGMALAVAASVFEDHQGSIPDCSVHGMGKLDSVAASLRKLGAIPIRSGAFTLRTNGNLIEFDLNERAPGQLSVHLLDVPDR